MIEPTEKVNCPYCQEPVSVKASICPHCQKNIFWMIMPAKKKATIFIITIIGMVIVWKFVMSM